MFKILALIIFLSLPVWAAPSTKPISSINSKSIELNEKGVQAVQSKNFQLAESFFRGALSADSKNLTAVINLATVLVTNKNELAAITLLEQYAKQDVKDAGIYARLGDAYFASKEIEPAARNYEKALSLDPRYPGVPKRLSTVYSLQNKMDKAEEMMLLAVEQEPKDGQLLANLSAVFLANGKIDKAISSAKRALQVKPNAETYVTLGTAYEINKDYKNSLIAFEKAMQLGDQRPELKKKIEGLRAVS